MSKNGAIPSMLSAADKTRYRSVVVLYNKMATKEEQVTNLHIFTYYSSLLDLYLLSYQIIWST